MATRTFKSSAPRIAKLVRGQIESGGERIWRFDDFAPLPFGAVAKELSRMQRKGMLERLGKGIYYRSRPTAFGNSRPNPATVRRVAAKGAKVFPAGLSAANMLGFTTQNPAKAEVSTTARTVPQMLLDEHTVVHARRPAAWESLSETDAAVLELLRLRGEPSELPDAETIQRLLALLAENGRFARLAGVSASEPPRVRAMLGALGEALGAKKNLLASLRETLNPLSRFEFGMLSGLESASRWQAKE